MGFGKKINGFTSQQIEVTTVHFSEENKASISSVLPILYGIIDNLSVADGDSSIVKSFKTTVVKSIKQGSFKTTVVKSIKQGGV